MRPVEQLEAIRGSGAGVLISHARFMRTLATSLAEALVS
jgi:hypothetical protein